MKEMQGVVTYFTPLMAKGGRYELLPLLSLLVFLLLRGAAAVSDAEPYNPDVDLNTPQTIRRHGYPAEGHTVQTEDGFLLTMHRIPRSPEQPSSVDKLSTSALPNFDTGALRQNKWTSLLDLMLGASGNALDEEASTTQSTTTTAPPPKPPPSRGPVLLHHGLMGSSYAWILAGPGKGLAYLLADAGYDVWMANARGNVYSRGHVHFPTDPSSPFWDFSFQEMGAYDLPAEIEYVLNVTGTSQLHYIGHSMGTTVFFVMASLRPDVAARVTSAYALAPIAFVKHMESPIRFLAPFSHDLEFLAHILGKGQLLPQNSIIKELSKYGCELLEIEKKLCENLIFVICGFDSSQFDPDLLPLIISHGGKGASTKTAIHYAQMINSGKFQQFDYGINGNLQKYNSTIPPIYDLSKVNVSMHMYYAKNDWLSSTTDVDTLYDSLQCKKTKYLIPMPTFNHLDFIAAKDVKKLLYDAILKELPAEKRFVNLEDDVLLMT